MNSIDDCKIIQLPKITDPRGNLTFLENMNQIPFEIKRVFYIYDVPAGESRGSHAHHNLKQFIICLSGSFDVLLDDGKSKKKIHLNKPWQGLFVPSMIWSSEANFDPSSVCLVLVSELYDPESYIRDYDLFIKLATTK